MLKQVGTSYHFRRTIPEHLRGVFGKREIWFSLRTSKKMVAKGRGAYLYAQTTALFEKAPYMSEDTIKHLLDLLKQQEQTYEFILKGQEKIHASERAELILARLQDFKAYENMVDKLQTGTSSLISTFEKVHFRNQIKAEMQREQIDDMKKIITDIGTARQNQSNQISESIERHTQNSSNHRYLISNVVAHHLKSKKCSEDTIKNTKRTLSLFISCFGDMDIRDIDGNIAGDFKDALQALPENWGKQRKNLSIQEEIDRVIAEDLETITQKTVKNHMGRLSVSLKESVNRGVIQRNFFHGWNYDLTAKVVRRAWTDDEIQKLIQSQWMTTVVSNQTYKAIVRMALYTGMRLGEIANIRNEDITEINGIPCFLVQHHDDTDWKPKTSAGIRKVPIHSKLMKYGIMNFMREGEKYLFAELKGSDSRARGQSFSNEFSKHKTSIGLPLAVTFHGFRHTVSTKLRNVKDDIREIWIDALLGHEPSHKSMGTMGYLSGIDIENLQQVVECVKYDCL
ncbi:phage integrase [Neokomagataea thailandica NBRC 106555]|uniref:Integrase n=2 Tax=Neokomagataea TaxID=1223423 RepID=A0A4Y6V6G0_9PROT|nr:MULTISPECIES: DUF6538 domain-containing protein [Neokomagataea]QDH25563.1 integrase [Neokomagataea tanensis]GBR55549.1 phage integrase [Neokomagataea thailandica NBRC 106555]